MAGVMAEWLRGKKPVPAAEVRKLEIGSRVTVHGADRHGTHTMLECTVVQRGKAKALAYRGWSGTETMAIRDYPGKAFTVEVSGDA